MRRHTPLSLVPILFLVLPVATTSAQHREVNVPVPTGVLHPAAGGPVHTEALELPAELLTAFRAVGRMHVTVRHFPIAAGVRDSVEFEPFDVYAGGARVWIQTGQGTAEAPRSRRLHFLGRSTADPRLRVGLSVDPDTGALRGLAASSEGLFEIVAPAAGSTYLVRRDGEGLAQELSFQCGNGQLPESAAALADPFAGVEPARARAAASRGASDPTYQATIAVDTDNEFNYKKFANDTADATDWIADLFLAMNVMYERDLSLRLLQGDTTLRLDLDPSPTYDDDPYTVTGSGASSSQLGEFGSYWSANMGSVDRVLAMLLSGKSSSGFSSSGIAWLDGYCEYQSSGGGYSVSQVFWVGGIPVTSDLRVIGHELGHNFGSHHTHCYSPPVDTCYNAEGGCYAGAVSCPPGGPGTIMSYCHFSPPAGAGCGSNLSEFHPTVITNLNGYITSHYPACIEPFTGIFSDGFESGDTSAWSSAVP